MKTFLILLVLSFFTSLDAAEIFYLTDQGRPAARPIYGVHPNSNISVPANVGSITVLETPDKIAWPVPAGQLQGKEQWSVVNTTTTPPTLEVKSGAYPAPLPAVKDFLADIRANFSLTRAREILNGSTIAALQHLKFSDLKQDLADDLAAARISQVESNLILQLGRNRNFPGW